MKRILVFTDKLSLSGASKIVAWLSNSLAERGFDIILVSYLPVEDQRAVSDKVKRIRLMITDDSKVSRGIKVINKLRSLIKESKPDLCIGFLPTECLYLQIANVFIGVKIIVCERSDPYFEKSLISSIGRFCYRYADGAVFQTEGAQAFFNENLQKKSIVIPNPAFPINGEIIPYMDRDLLVSTSGRLFIRQKRQDVLLKAFKIIVDRNPNVILNIYGEGKDRTELETLVDKLDLKTNVNFCGNIKNVEQEVAKTKVFVLSSDYEGIPNVIIEAMQYGVPVVSTDCSPGGATSLINDSINGYVVPRGDYEALARRIISIIENPKIGIKFIQEGQKSISAYKENDIIQIWIKYIASLICIER